MREAIVVRLGQAVECVQSSELKPKIGRIITLYICRLIGARAYRRAIKYYLPENPEIQQELFDLKESLDFSVHKNDLLRAVYELVTATTVDADFVLRTCKHHCIDCDDAVFLTNTLLEDDKASLTKRPYPNKYSHTEVAFILKKVDSIIKNLVNRKLAFITNSDPMLEGPEDLMEQLKLQAIRIIREYEIDGITQEHMIKNVVVGLKNHTVNLAEAHGRSKRQPIARTHKKEDYRTAWYLNINDFSIVPVKVSKHRDLRTKKGDSIQVRVRECTTDREILVHYKRLYHSEMEAQTAINLRRAGQYSKRLRYLDLSSEDEDEFQLTCVPIDQETENGATLHEKIAAPTYDDPHHRGLRWQNFLRKLGPKSREFAELVMFPAEDDFFTAWCTDSGKDASGCNCKKLGTIACDYLETTKQQLRAELLSTPSSMWTDRQLTLIANISKQSK